MKGDSMAYSKIVDILNAKIDGTDNVALEEARRLVSDQMRNYQSNMDVVAQFGFLSRKPRLDDESGVFRPVITIVVGSYEWELRRENESIIIVPIGEGSANCIHVVMGVLSDNFVSSEDEIVGETDTRELDGCEPLSVELVSGIYKLEIADGRWTISVTDRDDVRIGTDFFTLLSELK
jgi:hypothetical protein